MELLLCLNVWTCSLLFWWQSLIVKRIVAKCLQLDNTPLFLALSLSFTHCHLYPSCFSGLSVSQCFYLICLICSFSFLVLSLSPPYSLCIHVFSVQSSWASPFLLSLPCMHRHTQTHSYVLSISKPVKEVLLFPGRLGGLLGETDGGRERLKEFIRFDFSREK